MPAATTAATAPPNTFIGWLQTMYTNTVTNFGQGGWGVGLTANVGNLNTMRQILQAYFAVGLGKLRLRPRPAVDYPRSGNGTRTRAWVDACGSVAWRRPRGRHRGRERRTVHGQQCLGQLGRSRQSREALGARELARGDARNGQEAQLVSAARPMAAPQANGMLSGVPMAGNAGLGAGAGQRGSGYIVKYGVKHAVMPKPPAGG